MRAGKRRSAGIEGATFAPDRAGIGGRDAPLSTGGDVAAKFSEFLAWYFLVSHCKWAIPLTGSQVSSTFVSLF